MFILKWFKNKKWFIVFLARKENIFFAVVILSHFINICWFWWKKKFLHKVHFKFENGIFKSCPDFFKQNSPVSTAIQRRATRWNTVYTASMPYDLFLWKLLNDNVITMTRLYCCWCFFSSFDCWLILMRWFFIRVNVLLSFDLFCWFKL